MSNLFTIAGQIAGAWATAAELLPLLAVPAAVWGIRLALEALDALARAAQLTYAAGRAAGRLWFAHGQPALLAAADGISWLIAEIDWAEAMATAAAAGRAALALAITAAMQAHHLLIAGSARMGRLYAALLVPATTAPAAPAPAPVAPAAAAVRRDRRRISSHCPGLRHWAESADAEIPLRWCV
jgi:hypothetical protein